MQSEGDDSTSPKSKAATGRFHAERPHSNRQKSDCFLDGFFFSRQSAAPRAILDRERFEGHCSTGLSNSSECRCDQDLGRTWDGRSQADDQILLDFPSFNKSAHGRFRSWPAFCFSFHVVTFVAVSILPDGNRNRIQNKPEMIFLSK